MDISWYVKAERVNVPIAFSFNVQVLPPYSNPVGWKYLDIE
jgi:hypothetical protein